MFITEFTKTSAPPPSMGPILSQIRFTFSQYMYLISVLMFSSYNTVLSFASLPLQHNLFTVIKCELPV